MIKINGLLKDELYMEMSPLSHGVAYGFGLFETIKIHNNTMFFLEEHIKRLRASCYKLKIPFRYETKEIEKQCIDLIKHNEIINGSIKVSYIKNIDKYDLIISTDNRIYDKSDYKNGFTVSLASIKKNPYSLLTYIKSNNYMENLLARNEALEKGYNEVLFLNVHDIICEGSISNIFFIKDDTVFTPSISCGILDGVIRKKVISLLMKLDIRVVIGKFSLDKLYDADEVFLTNSLMEIMPVKKIENKVFKNRKIINQITKEYYKYFYVGD